MFGALFVFGLIATLTVLVTRGSVRCEFNLQNSN